MMMSPRLLLLRRPPSVLLTAGRPRADRPSSVRATADGAKPAAPQNPELSTLQKNVYRHTLTSLYVDPADRVPDIPAIDWDQRRRKRERAEILEAAGRRPKGGGGGPPPPSQKQIEEGLDSLEALLPGVPVGSLDLLKASEWARVAADPARAARAALALRAAFPRADTAAIIKRAPRLALLRDPEAVAKDAKDARAALDPTLGRDDLSAVDAAVELVPELATPKGIATALSLLSKWYPSQDPYELLRKDPTMLVNQEESNLEADPIYGEVTSAG